MLKKTPVIIFLLLIAALFFLLYQEWKIPDGVIPQSEQENINAKLAFWGSIIVFATSIVGLFQKIIELLIEVKKKND